MQPGTISASALRSLLKTTTRDVDCEVLSHEGSIYLVSVIEGDSRRTLWDGNGAKRFNSAWQAGRFLSNLGWEGEVRMVHRAAHDEIIGRPSLDGEPEAEFPVGTDDT